MIYVLCLGKLWGMFCILGSCGKEPLEWPLHTPKVAPNDSHHRFAQLYELLSHTVLEFLRVSKWMLQTRGCLSPLTGFHKAWKLFWHCSDFHSLLKRLLCCGTLKHLQESSKAGFVPQPCFPNRVQENLMARLWVTTIQLYHYRILGSTNHQIISAYYFILVFLGGREEVCFLYDKRQVSDVLEFCLHSEDT